MKNVSDDDDFDLQREISKPSSKNLIKLLSLI